MERVGTQHRRYLQHFRLTKMPWVGIKSLQGDKKRGANRMRGRGHFGIR
jgi:hypothetical protein